jgi:hypothetical protein
VLNALLKKDAAWNWSKMHEDALQRAKILVAEHVLTTIPDFNKPFSIRCDASDRGVGGYLFQVDEGIERIICVWSKAFTGTQVRWATVDKEA